MIEKVCSLAPVPNCQQFYPRLTLDFHTNKKICDEVAVIPSKRLRNKIAGFTTHLMRRYTLHYIPDS
jgi:ribosomal protein S17E